MSRAFEMLASEWDDLGMLTIGQLAKAGGISVDAIRYYERLGLLMPEAKTRAGYRLYAPGTAQTIHFIQHAQECGFTLAEIWDLLQLRQKEKVCCNDIRRRVIEKKNQLEARIKTMQSVSASLDHLISEGVDRELPVEDCPILTSLEQGDIGKN